MGHNMISNGVLRSSSFFIQEILTLECFSSLAYTTAYYCTAISLLYLNCVRDFCEIFIFITSKITQRVIWTLEVTGLIQSHKKNEGVFSYQGIGNQTDINVPKNTELTVSVSPVNNVKISPSISINTKQLCQNKHEVRLPSPQSNIISTRTCSVLDGPAVLMLTNDKPTTPNDLIHRQQTSQSPVCRIHMTPCPKNLRAKYAKVVVDNLSPEERYSYLKRKWQKWNLKNNSRKQYLSMESLFSNHLEKYSGEDRKPKKARMSSDSCDCNKNGTILEEESPEVGSCYKNVMSRLKSKFTRRDSAIATYKTF